MKNDRYDGFLASLESVTVTVSGYFGECTDHDVVLVEAEELAEYGPFWACRKCGWVDQMFSPEEGA